MRCQASIWRWSPFFGICASKFTGASGWTMYGAKVFSSTLTRRSLSAFQFASSPSPSEVARPMPVIQTSADPALEDLISVMGDQFLRKSDALGHGVHVYAQIRVGEGDMRERDRGAGSQFAADGYLRGSDGKARTFVNDAGGYFQQLPGADETPHLGFLHRAEERHALEFGQRDQEPARGLRHRLDQQHAGHDRVARKVTFEDSVFLGNLRLGRNGLLADIEVGDAVDQFEIFKLHGARLGARALGRDQFVDARGEIFQDKILFGGRLAVIDLLGPLLQRQLDPERLVDRERDVQKIQAVDPQIVDGVVFGRDRIAWNVAGFRDNVSDLIECGGHH